MAVSLPSDIVLDVARAADPAEVATARAELLRRPQAASGASFSVAEPGTASGGFGGIGRAFQPQSPAEASKKFEAMVLQTFISSMMPKNAEDVYGKGLAGDMWKSMMSEKIADVVAERGGIGIAARVMGDFQVEDDKKVPIAGVTPLAEAGDAPRPTLVASAMVEQMERRLARDLASGAKAESSSLFTR